MRPQMQQKEINKLEQILVSYGKHVDVLEWGSGGSTVYFTHFLKDKGISYTWTSIEYNKTWYERIYDQVKEDRNVSLVLFDVGNDRLKQPNIPMNDYVAYPATLEAKYDVIIVDGRKRRRCILEGLKLLKPGGAILLHDARRTYYHSAFSDYPDSRILLYSGLWQGKLDDPSFVQKGAHLLFYWCFRIYTFSFRFKHMASIKKFLINLHTYSLNLFKKEEKIDEAKMKWNALAKKDANYYIFTDKSVSDSEQAFKKSGEHDVKENFLNDEVIRGIIGEGREARVLEIGCGVGRLSEFIAPHVSTLYAVDISEEMISKAQSRLSDYKNIEFIATDGMSFPIGSESVEAVFSFIVFQHMPSVEIVRKNIVEIARVLKNGGIAKIQLRGIPVSRDKWYYGPSFDKVGVENLIKDTSLKVLKSEGEAQKYFWVWLKKSI